MPFATYETRQTDLGNGVMGSIGSVRLYRPDASATADFYSPPLPLGLSKLDARSTNIVYNQQAFSVGGWSDNTVTDEDYRFMRQGIVPWDGVPTAVASAGPGPTGSCRCAIRFRDSFNNEVSPLSAYTAAFTLTNQQRSWSNLPVAGPEDEGILDGTTTANAATAIVGSGTAFTRELQIGDEVSVSSAPSTFAKVLAVTDDQNITVSVALGNGTSQHINVRKIPRWDAIDLMVEMDSGLTRVAATIPIGVTSYIEGTATLALGEAHTTAFERMPRGTAGTFYHERQWVIDYSDTAYASALFEPERHEGLKVRTKNGEPIIAIWPAGNDKLLVITSKNTYYIHGYTASDVVIDMEDEEHGGLNHWACLNINGRIFVPNAKTISMYDNTYHNILEDSERFWADQYAAHQDEYEAAFAVHDPQAKTYELYVSGAVSFSELYNPAGITIQTVGWTLSYSGIISQAGGGFTQPDLSFEVMGRKIHAGALMFKPGARRGDVYLGACDGFIRKRDENNQNDDGDTYGKRMSIRSRAEQGASDAGGDVQEGKDFDRLWTFMENEENAVTVSFLGGDETAWKAIDPDNVSQWWTESVPAQKEVNILLDDGFAYDYVPATTRVHPVSRVSGRYVTGLWSVLSPHKGFRWRGWGGVWGPGAVTRPYLRQFNPS